MKFLLYFYLFLFLNCQSQNVGSISLLASTEIPFEDQYHYSYSLTENNFLLIDTQDKMDKVYSIIHKKNGGNRLAPIPTVTDEETFIIIKPSLKNTNDVSIDKITLDKGILYIKVKEFNNPNFNTASRSSPNILLKLLKKTTSKKIITQY